MKKYISVLKNTILFSGVSEEEIAPMFSCLDAKLRTYKKGEYILHQGDLLRHITVLVQGELHIQRDDFWGNRSIIHRIAPGEMFGEAYLAPDGGTVVNDVVSIEESVVIFFDIDRMMTTCSSSCQFHTRVIRNLFYAISEKNRRLVEKLGHMSKRTTREKLISYLSEVAKQQNSSCFTIPFNRQQLADFLSVDRSAMSNELCKMRDEGLLEFHKNQFRLL
ncbi:MAG: Crp/Fnr family transcriptional regulator [Clostridia bacterium]|nr:Crp/Fnr family transcriptional regulator [Clostridia bacterium]